MNIIIAIIIGAVAGASVSFLLFALCQAAGKLNHADEEERK